MLRDRELPADSLWGALVALYERAHDGGRLACGPTLEAVLGADRQQGTRATPVYEQR